MAITWGSRTLAQCTTDVRGLRIERLEVVGVRDTGLLGVFESCAVAGEVFWAMWRSF